MNGGGEFGGERSPPPVLPKEFAPPHIENRPPPQPKTFAPPDPKNDEVSRVIQINDREANKDADFCSNRITTSKYKLWNFIPKNLFEQFRRAANFYFLIIAILQLIPGVSPTSPFTSIAPLLAVLSVTAIKEAVEDIARHKADDEENNRTARVLRNGRFVDEAWVNVHVGDVIRLTEGQFSPSDLVILATSEPDGMCYVETKSLDGETNLKIRQSLPATNHLTDEASLSTIRGVIECQPPNPRLYEYHAYLAIEDGALDDVHHAVKKPLTLKQTVLRGCIVRHSHWVHAVVVYTGQETKLMMNATKTRAKRSTLEKKMNTNVLFVFLIQGCVCLFSAIYAASWLGRKAASHSYLGYKASDIDPALYALSQFFTFVILYNVLVPISLYVSVEMVKVVHKLLIGFDTEMYDAVSSTHAKANTSNLSEELGQIQYVFSDKTGTLTQNVMAFMKCSIAGVSYGKGVSQAAAGAAARFGLADIPEPVAVSGTSGKGEEEGGTPFFNFEDERLLKHLHEGHATAPMIREFLLLLALCHTVVIDKDDSEGRPIYQAASPDEGALVEAARQFGYEFIRRSPTTVTILVDGKEETYSILNILEFTSDRKRMSVIVRAPNGQIKLYCKGADTVVYPRLRQGVDFEESTLTHLEGYANDGLRTLVLAMTTLNEDAYDAWNRVYHNASIATVDRESKLADAAELIEKNFVLLGATAIEDKLQDGVPETIAELAKAGMKIWVLTGDKVETAINIGFACKLLSSSMNLATIVDCTSTQAVLKRVADIRKAIDDAPLSLNALVIDGVSLLSALEEECEREFIKLLRVCRAVVACRVSPKQKADVVKAVRKHEDAVTLAIGDGANDVSMIQSAHVGVGISGQEGLQAARASDYSIAQFRFLHRLLLVHGRWNYKRIATLILYSFYKNFAFCLTQLWFQFFCAFSGQTVMDDMYISTYNLMWTGLPILIVAVFEQDVIAPIALREPRLYRAGQHDASFNFSLFVSWLSEGVFHSLVCSFIPYLAVGLNGSASIRADGRSDDVFLFGTIVYTCVIVTVSLKLGSITRFWTWVNHLALWGSIGGWFVVLYFYTLIPMTHVSGMTGPLFSSGVFWFCVLLAPAVCLIPPVVYTYFRELYYPRLYEMLRELQRLGELGTFDSDEGEDGGFGSSDRQVGFVAPSNMPKQKSGSSKSGGRRTIAGRRAAGRTTSFRSAVYAIQAIHLMQDSANQSHRGFNFAHESGHAEFIMLPNPPKTESYSDSLSS